jgi:hypothetical protein
MHWHRYPSFVDRLEQYGFRVLVLARHPLDVLISILHFAMHEPTSRWLEGEEGTERPIFGAMPRSTAFLDYATGPRAAALLSVSREWWRTPGCVPVRYESLVQDPQSELARLQEVFGLAARKPIAEVLAATTLRNLRVLNDNIHHFWQGRVGLWRSLLTAAEATRIAEAQGPVFSELGYACDPDPHLTGREADANWTRLAWEALVDDLQNLRILQRDNDKLTARCTALEADLAAAKARVEACEQDLHQAISAQAELERARQTQGARLQYLEARLAEAEGLGPNSLRFARKLNRFAGRHPRASALVKRMLRLSA